MWTRIAKIIWLMMPAYFSTMMPVFVSRLNFLNHPVDFNKKLFIRTIFGKNKTWRGIIFGTLIGLIVAFVQFLLLKQFTIFSEIVFLDYSNFLIIGFLIGFGGLLGDLFKSFIKRQLSIRSGKFWFPFDQIDYSIGALICFSFYKILPLNFIVLAIVVSSVLHLVFVWFAYRIKLRK